MVNALKHKIVKKLWGNELWIVNNSKYCGKILTIRKGARCSLHFHPRKDETFFVLSGKVKLYYNGSEFIMNKFNSFRIEPGNKHRFESIDKESKILEVSTYHDDEDVVRVQESEIKKGNRLCTIIKNFRSKRIVVIGDIMLDRYVFGSVDRISPEAPVPVISTFRNEYRLGGASNVANIIKHLGATPILFGVVGDDDNGRILLNLLAENQISCLSGNFIDRCRKTTVKTRIVSNNYAQQLMRIDEETCKPISKKVENKIFGMLKHMTDVDAVLFADYDKGVLSKSFIHKIIRAFKGKIIVADPKYNNFFTYKNVTIFKPNINELMAVTNKNLTKENCDKVCLSIKRKLNCKGVMLTVGKDGMILYDDKKRLISAKEFEVFDEVGAGDTVSAVMTLALTSGASFFEAGKIANIAAGIEVGKFGTSPITTEELLANIQSNEYLIKEE